MTESKIESISNNLIIFWRFSDDLFLIFLPIKYGIFKIRQKKSVKVSLNERKKCYVKKNLISTRLNQVFGKRNSESKRYKSLQVFVDEFL